MASETDSTALNDLCAAAIAEASMVMSQGVNLRDYCTVRPLPKGKSGVTFPMYSEPSAAALTESTDLTSNTEVSTSGVTVTPTEAGLMTVLTDIADYASNPLQVGTDIGKLFGEAIRAYWNNTIWALFDGFSQAVGSSNNDITEANVIAGVRTLRNAKAPPPYYLAITPHIAEDLMTIYATNTSNTAESIRNAVVEKGIMPPIHGCIPIVVDNLPSGTSSGDRDSADAKAGMFSRAALGFVEGYGIRIEKERNASMRGTEIVATTYFGVDEIYDVYGVEVLVDNKDA